MARESDSEFGSVSSSDDYVYVYPYSLPWLSTVPLTMSLIVLITITGNVFVIMAYLRDKRIRENVANILIVNLAVADLFVGLLIMTVNIHWVVKDYWSFGEVFCKFWSSMDHVLSMMSILSMLLITWDRYCLMTMGMRYRSYQTKTRLGVCVMLCWTICLVVYVCILFGWTAVTGRKDIDYSESCEPEFSVSLTATLIILTLEFVIPVTILVVLNVIVYANIRKRSKGVVVPSRPEMPTVSRRQSSDIDRDGVDIPGSYGRPPVTDMFPSPCAPESEGKACSGGRNVALHVVTAIGPDGTPTLDTPTGRDPCREAAKNSSKVEKEKRTFVKHRKAAIVLAVLVGCFLVCYLPYHIASISFALCQFGCVPQLTWEVSAMLLWCNSTINPFIYAATNTHFRRNFCHFLLLDRWACQSGQCVVKHRREHFNTSTVHPETTCN